MNKEIVFYINKSEITAGSRGASLGPEAIITAARKRGSTIFSNIETKELDHCNSLLDRPTEYQFAKRIDGLLKVYQLLNDDISKILSQNKFPLILAADHGSAGGTIAGIRSAHPNKRLGVVWIDAHADIHTPFTTPTGNLHGMPLATALDQDNLESKVNEVPEPTIRLWDQLKSVGNIKPKIYSNDLVYIGVRDTEEQEDSIMSRLNIKNFTIEEVRQLGVDAVMKQINEKLSDCDIIYASFDVDSMDPDLTSYGTGTPVKNGLTPHEAQQILVDLIDNPKTVCLEIVEVNPCLDDKINKMAEVAFDLLEVIFDTTQK
jgi:arginase